MSTAENTKYCKHCRQKIAASALKCENCKSLNANISTESLVFGNLEIKQENGSTENAYDNQAPWTAMACLETGPLKVELPKGTSNKRQRKSNSSKSEVLQKIEQQEEQPLSKTALGNLDLYKCDTCDKSFKRLSSLKAHQSYFHGSDFDSEDDTVKYKRKCLRNEEDDAVKFKEKYFQNATTNKYQPALKLASDSESDTTSDGSSTISIDVDSVQTDLNTLYEALTKSKKTPIGESVYKCRLCNKITLLQQEHVKHIITHTGRKWLTCVLCNDVFLCTASLNEHVSQAHSLGVGNKDDEYLPCGIFKCRDCDAYFLSPSEFDRHKRWHAGKQLLFNCNICQVALTTRPMLEKHTRIIHGYDQKLTKRFKCFICGEGFPFQIVLTNHKRKHPEFFQLIERTTFVQHSANSERKLYSCRACGKSTTCQTTHFDHLRTHSDKFQVPNPPKFQCYLCEKQFTSKSTLNAHVRLHTDERPFKCEICAISYRHRKSLRKHLIKHTGERPVKCKYCGSGFMDQHACAEHVRRVHTGETPYRCDICTEWFTSCSQLPLHKLQKHNVDTRMKRTVDVILEKAVDKIEIEDTQLAVV